MFNLLSTDQKNAIKLNQNVLTSLQFYHNFRKAI